jgi:hypothetical protein
MGWNFWKVKKWGGIFVAGMLPLFIFLFFLFGGYDLMMSLSGAIIGVLLGGLILSMMMKHPFLELLGGDGLLVLTFDSTGVIKPYIAKVMSPFISTVIDGQRQDTIFDRDSVFYTGNPGKAEISARDPSDGFIHYDMKVKKGEETSITFGFLHYPTFIFNKNMGAFLTKDALGKMETEAVIKHLVLYLKKKTEELTSIMRDFARYVMSRPKGNMFAGLFGNWLFWIVLIGGAGLLLFLFWPSISGIFSSGVAQTGEMITPR